MHIYVYIYIHAHNILYRYLQVLRMWICLHYVHGPKAPCLSGESWMVPEPREARRHDWWHGCDTVPGMKSYMTGMERSEKNIWKIWGMGRVLLIWGALAAKLWLSDLLIGFGTVSETVGFILSSMKGGDLSLRTYVGSNKIIQQYHDPTQKTCQTNNTF